VDHDTGIEFVLSRITSGGGSEVLWRGRVVCDCDSEVGCGVSSLSQYGVGRGKGLGKHKQSCRRRASVVWGGSPPPLFVTWGRGHNQFSSVQSHNGSEFFSFFLSFFGLEDPSQSLDHADFKHPFDHLGPKKLFWTG